MARSESGHPDGTIAIDATSGRDIAIAVRIRAKIRQLDGSENVSVDAPDGFVTLGDTVTDAARISAQNALVARVEGVVAIETGSADKGACESKGHRRAGNGRPRTAGRIGTRSPPRR